jgi:two-component system, chemotaxis family, chemotaxis protein CheY
MNAKVLIVDDSGLARRTLRQLLEDQGHTVEDAPDGTRALEVFFLHKPDLVVLDMVMNGMYGLEVLQKLRELDPDVKVIVATADIQDSTAAQSKAGGAKGILNKPINKAQLIATVDKVLAGEETWN